MEKKLYRIKVLSNGVGELEVMATSYDEAKEKAERHFDKHPEDIYSEYHVTEIKDVWAREEKCY